MLLHRCEFRITKFHSPRLVSSKNTRIICECLTDPKDSLWKSVSTRLSITWVRAQTSSTQKETTLRHVGYKEDCEIGIAIWKKAINLTCNIVRKINRSLFSKRHPWRSPTNARCLGDLVICIPVVLQEALEQLLKIILHIYWFMVFYIYWPWNKRWRCRRNGRLRNWAKLNIANPYQES